jgi:hypothetical protein
MIWKINAETSQNILLEIGTLSRENTSVDQNMPVFNVKIVVQDLKKEGA